MDRFFDFMKDKLTDNRKNQNYVDIRNNVQLIESQILKICIMRIPFLVTRCKDYRIRSVEIFGFSIDECYRIQTLLDDLDLEDNDKIYKSLDLKRICNQLNNQYDSHFYLKKIKYDDQNYDAIFVSVNF